MVVGIGIDFVEVERVGRKLRENAGFREEVFTEGEIAYCENKRYSAEHFAARFCAKEALFKALGCGFREGMRWREVEIESEASGQPKVNVRGKIKALMDEGGVGHVFLSMSHTRQTAVAVIVLESQEFTKK